MNETTYSLNELFHKNRHGSASIANKSIQTLSSEADRLNMPPWYSSIDQTKPNLWNSVDTFIVRQLGFRVRYDNSFGKYKKSLDRFSSNLTNQKLKLLKSKLSESDIIKNVNYISTDCNLVNTTLKSIPSWERVGCNLTVYATSSLKDLHNLKEIGGNLNVVAKNKEEMNEFLVKLGIMDKDGSFNTKIDGKISFIMKSYL